MDGLVVVHTESRHIDQGYAGPVGAARNLVLYRRIVGEINADLAHGQKVYYLSEDGTATVPPLAASFLEKMEFFPCNGSFEVQYLQAKAQAIKDGVDKVEISGYSFDGRTGEVKDLFEGIATRNASNKIYELAAMSLDWDFLRFHDVFFYPLEAMVRQDLSFTLANIY